MFDGGGLWREEQSDISGGARNVGCYIPGGPVFGGMEPTCLPYGPNAWSRVSPQSPAPLKAAENRYEDLRTLRGCGGRVFDSPKALSPCGSSCPVPAVRIS